MSFGARTIDWGVLSPLRLRARELAHGLYAGSHRSTRRGAGVEFGGFREYTVGDDLRWLDRRSLLLYDRTIVRQFETETDRTIFLLVDATRSMRYRGSRALASKYAYASALAAGVSKVALNVTDPVALSLLGPPSNQAYLAPRGGRLQFERIVTKLESFEPEVDASGGSQLFSREIEHVARVAKRGAISLLFSDFLDIADEQLRSIAMLTGSRRSLIAVRVLDPDEVDFPFSEAQRFVALEGDHSIEAQAETVRDSYLRALQNSELRLKRELERFGARYVSLITNEAPGNALLRVVRDASPR